MSKDVNAMTQDELRAEVLRLRDKMKDDAVKYAYELQKEKQETEKVRKRCLRSPGMGR